MSYESEVLADSPRSYWRLGEEEGTTAADSSGKGHPGTYVNTPTLGVAGAILDGNPAVKLDSASKEHILVAAHIDHALGDVFTLEAWVKREQAGTNQSIISKGPNAYQLRIEGEENKLQLLRQDATILRYGAVVPEDGKWHHVVATKNGATSKMYVDGVENSTGGTNATCTNNVNALRIGCKTEGTEHLHGGVDEVAVYATPLSDARIKAHYDAGAPPLETEPADSCWEFDGDATDSVGPNDGEEVGGPDYADPLVTSEHDGRAIELDGASQYINVPDHPSLRLDGSFRLTAWAERGSDTGIQELLRKGADFRFYMPEGSGLAVEWEDEEGGEHELVSPTDILPGRFYRLSAIYDEAAETVTLCVNGRPVKSGAATAPPKVSEADLSIGARGSNEDRFWSGRLDKVRVRSGAHSAAQELAEYREESEIIWAEGLESGDLSRCAELQEIDGSLEVIAADPDPPAGIYAMRATVDKEGERAEIIPGHIHLSEGDEVFAHVKFYLEPGFAASGWGTLILQLRDQGDNSPATAFYIRPGLQMAVEGGPATGLPEITYWEGPVAEIARWYDALVRVKFDEDPEVGEVGVWLNGIEQPLLSSKGRTAVGSSYPKFGLYRDTAITSPGSVVLDAFELRRTMPVLVPSIDPTAFKPARKPPLALDVEVEIADGDPIRLASDSRVASNRPQGLWFSTQRGDGFGPGGCSFARQIFKEYPDISPMDTWRAIGRNGDIAYEGRLFGSPRGNNPQRVDVNLVGWMTYPTGRRCAPLIVDRRFSSWAAPTVEERVRHGGLSRSVFDSAADAVDGLALRWTGRLAGGVDAICPVYFDAGDNKVGEVYYDFTIPKSSLGNEIFSNAEAFLGFFAADDDHATGAAPTGGNLRAASGSGYLTPSAQQQWAYLFWLFTNATAFGEQGEEFTAMMKTLAVYGATGLERHGGPPGGVWLSECIRYILARYFPKINWAGQTNTYPVTQAAWQDNPTEGYQLIQNLNMLANWETSMWENRSFHFHPADLTRYDWVIDTTDPGVEVNFDGPSIENFANGVEVTFTDFSGRTQVLYPSDHPELRDEDDSNPANRHGENLWTTAEVPWPCFEAEALQYGRAKLGDFNRPRRPGSFTIKGGYIRDGAGNWQQGWKVRSSQTLGILNHLDDTPRLIYSTPRWDQDTKTLNIAVDAPPKDMESTDARQMRAREAANLT